MARITLMLADSHSLKDKRMVIRRIKDRVRERLGVFVNEVGASEVKDSWQRGELGVAIASSDRTRALALIDEVIRVAMSAGGAQISAVAKDAITFDAEPAPFAVIDDRTGSGDKAAGAQAGDDGAWVPDAWREELES